MKILIEDSDWILLFILEGLHVRWIPCLKISLFGGYRKLMSSCLVDTMFEGEGLLSSFERLHVWCVPCLKGFMFQNLKY